MRVAAIDIGGSSVKGAAVDVGSTDATIVGDTATEPLPSNEFSDLVGVVRSVAVSLTGDAAAERIGICTTGSVDRAGVVVSAGHFNGYVDVDWQQELSDSVHVERIVTTNDGHASAWAEQQLDPDHRSSIVHAVVGTGVGGGVVYDGKLLLGDSGQSGYLGHLKVAESSVLQCSCRKRGCVEALAAGPELARLWSEEEGMPSSIEGLVGATRSGSAGANQCWRRVGRWLGIGLGNAMNITNPALVTVGGGIAQASADAFGISDQNGYLDAVREGIEYASHRRVFSAAEIRLAQFGNDGGLVGAALLAAA